MTHLYVSKQKTFWKPDVDKFLLKLNSPAGQLKAEEFLNNYETEGDIDDMSNDLVDLIKWASINEVKAKKRKKKSKTKNNPWYDDECRKKKGCLNRAVKRFREDPFNRMFQDDVFVAKKNFKKICRDRESCLRKKLVNKLLSFENDNPTEFWKLIKKMQKWGKSTDEPTESIPPSE